MAAGLQSLPRVTQMIPHCLDDRYPLAAHSAPILRTLCQKTVNWYLFLPMV